MAYHRPIIRNLGRVIAFLSPVLKENLKNLNGIDWRIKKLKEFIDFNVEKAAWNFGEVCHQLDLGIGAQHATRLFERSIGIGLREYAARYRFEKAAERLRSTARSVKEIAGELGYRNPQDLSRGFKKAFAMSPTEYRRTYHSIDAMWSEKRQ